MSVPRTFLAVHFLFANLSKSWSHHPVSVHRYHFIIPLVADVDENNSQGIGKGRKLCPNCSAVIASNAKRCTACGHDAVRGTLLESQTHLLHGVIHTNGYGHLLRINGRERGSRLVTGRQLMGLWDRICTMLNAREVTCMDMSKKLGLDLRLLHGLAYGHSWYGRWGYRFGKGCYGVTEDVYKHAVVAAAATPLAVIEEHYRGLDPDLVAIFEHYRSWVSENTCSLTAPTLCTHDSPPVAFAAPPAHAALPHAKSPAPLTPRLRSQGQGQVQDPSPLSPRTRLGTASAPTLTAEPSFKVWVKPEREVREKNRGASAGTESDASLDKVSPNVTLRDSLGKGLAAADQPDSRGKFSSAVEAPDNTPGKPGGNSGKVMAGSDVTSPRSRQGKGLIRASATSMIPSERLRAEGGEEGGLYERAEGEERGLGIRGEGRGVGRREETRGMGAREGAGVAVGGGAMEGDVKGGKRPRGRSQVNVFNSEDEESSSSSEESAPGDADMPDAAGGCVLLAGEEGAAVSVSRRGGRERGVSGGKSGRECAAYGALDHEGQTGGVGKRMNVRDSKEEGCNEEVCKERDCEGKHYEEEEDCKQWNCEGRDCGGKGCGDSYENECGAYDYRGFYGPGGECEELGWYAEHAGGDGAGWWGLDAWEEELRGEVMQCGGEYGCGLLEGEVRGEEEVEGEEGKGNEREEKREGGEDGEEGEGVEVEEEEVEEVKEEGKEECMVHVTEPGESGEALEAGETGEARKAGEAEKRSGEKWEKRGTDGAVVGTCEFRAGVLGEKDEEEGEEWGVTVGNEEESEVKEDGREKMEEGGKGGIREMKEDEEEWGWEEEVMVDKGGMDEGSGRKGRRWALRGDTDGGKGGEDGGKSGADGGKKGADGGKGSLTVDEVGELAVRGRVEVGRTDAEQQREKVKSEAVHNEVREGWEKEDGGMGEPGTKEGREHLEGRERKGGRDERLRRHRDGVEIGEGRRVGEGCEEQECKRVKRGEGGGMIRVARTGSDCVEGDTVDGNTAENATVEEDTPVEGTASLLQCRRQEGEGAVEATQQAGHCPKLSTPLVAGESTQAAASACPPGPPSPPPVLPKPAACQPSLCCGRAKAQAQSRDPPHFSEAPQAHDASISPPLAMPQGHVAPMLAPVEMQRRLGPIPVEYVVVPADATVAQLGEAIERTMRDTYCAMSRFSVSQLPLLAHLQSSALVRPNLSPRCVLLVRGSGMDAGSDLCWEGGSEGWVVECSCGTRDDDGEQMVACDRCEVWQHTRCAGLGIGSGSPLGSGVASEVWEWVRYQLDVIRGEIDPGNPEGVGKGSREDGGGGRGFSTTEENWRDREQWPLQQQQWQEWERQGGAEPEDRAHVQLSLHRASDHSVWVGLSTLVSGAKRSLIRHLSRVFLRESAIRTAMVSALRLPVAHVASVASSTADSSNSRLRPASFAPLRVPLPISSSPSRSCRADRQSVRAMATEPAAIPAAAKSSEILPGEPLPEGYERMDPYSLIPARRCGVLVHPTSLPGPHGIGDLGPGAFRFLDWLESTGCTIWQVLPLVPPGRKSGEDGSPYAGQDANCGNTLLLSLDLLVQDGLLKPEDLPPTRPVERVDYKQVIIDKDPAVAKAAKALVSSEGELKAEFDAFRQSPTISAWLEEAALFSAIDGEQGVEFWWLWPKELRDREPNALAAARERHQEYIDEFAAQQFLFQRQWQALHRYANSKGISIMGDMPIYVGGHSADVWANPEQFMLDPETRQPTFVSGVPPDAFSATGQLWG
ncbi:unnamed protein product, partial [Closterium sp. Yama58-4]